MMKLFFSNRRLLTFGVFAAILNVGVGAAGPLSVDGEPVVSIYRDYDDGLFGRSLYRGVIFSIRPESFGRYRTLPVRDLDGLSAYLMSEDRAADLAQDRGFATRRDSLIDGEAAGLDDTDPAKWLYVFEDAGTQVVFSLERAPDDLYDEIERTYASNPAAAGQVSQSYRSAYVIRIREAENVFRPEIARIDYEDVLVSAALLGDTFQPLWGIHDGNDAAAPQ